MADTPGTRASLLVRLRDPDDASAWNLFVDLYAPLIYGYFRKRGAQDADAADLTQEVLARVSRAIQRLDYDPARGTFRGWLFTIVRNRWCSWSSRPRMPQEHVPLEDQAAPSADLAWEEDYRRRLFAWAAAQVQPTVASTTWQAFWLTSVEGQKVTQVGATLNLSVAAVYMARSRVLARLKVTLAEADGVGWDL